VRGKSRRRTGSTQSHPTMQTHNKTS
jgi:hypothetical protein